MITELTYRLWNSAKKQFENPENYYLSLVTGKIMLFSATTNSFTDINDDIIPLRYTGKQDCNGVEIFQNCIVKNKREGMYSNIILPYPGGMFDIVDRDEDYDENSIHNELLSNCDGDKFEVVGNIYENENEFKNEKTI